MSNKETNTIIDPLTGQPIAVGQPITEEPESPKTEEELSVELTVDQPTPPKKEKAKPRKAPTPPPAEESDLSSSIKRAINEQAREDERAQSANLSLAKILGGDILSSELVKKNIWLMILIAVFVVAYISVRYSVQKELIEMDQLYNRLDDAKYRALSSSSQLTEECRESHVLNILKNSKDSVIKMAEQPPYIINVPNN